MNKQDQQFEVATARLLSGEKFEVIAKDFSNQEELLANLKIAQQLHSIPIAQAPLPQMRYKFAEKTSIWQNFLNIITSYRLAAVPLVIAFLIVSSAGIVEAAEQSLPGDKLYGVKLAAEQAQIKLTFDEKKLAELQVKLTNKRLQETRLILELDDPHREAIALMALSKQTQITLETTSSLAASKVVNENDPSLLENLVAIQKEKRSLLESNIKSPEAKKLANEALVTDKENGKNLARLIAAASEQSMLDLPNKISVTGILAQLGNSFLVVENNTFIISPETIILTQAGDILPDIKQLSGQIVVIGSRDNNKTIAKKIVVIDPEATLPEPTPQPTTASVKGVSTINPGATPSPTSKLEPVSSSPVETEVQKPSEAQAGFIVEPSANQYPR